MRTFLPLNISAVGSVMADMQNLTKTAAYSILPSFEIGKNLAPYPCTNILGLCIRVFLHTKGNPF